MTTRRRVKTTMGMTKTEKEYTSKREYAFDLFSESWSREDVADLLDITINTSKTYYQQWKKTQGLVKARKCTKETIDEVQRGEESSTITSSFELHETVFEVGNDTYTVDYYIDLEDGSVWFNFMTLLEIIKKENIFKPSTCETNISKRYFKSEVVDGATINLLDKNALIDFAKEINDFTLQSSIVKFLTQDYGYFYKFNSIVQALELSESYLRSIDEQLHKIKAYDNCQSDILHEMDNNHNDSIEQRFERFERLESLRLARREVKNEFVLSHSVKGLFGYHKIEPKNINFMSVKLKENIMSLYNKVYNPRAEKLDDMQKELLAEIISK